MIIASIYNRHDCLCRVDTGDHSKVAAEFAHETNINTIVDKYLRTGYIPPQTVTAAFEDVSNLGDYHSLIERVNAAQASFMELPSAIRDRFKNDPSRFIEFMQNIGDDNLQEAIDLGLVIRPNRGGGNSDLLDVTVPTDTKEDNKE